MNTIVHTAARLHYRPFEPADLPGLLRLWEAHSGWGGITQEQYQRWYLETPYGPCPVVVGVDDAGIVAAQLVYIPALVSLQGRTIKAARLSSPILAAAYGNAPITNKTHPVIGLLQEGTRLCQSLGYKLLYTFPAKGWTAVLQRFPTYGLPPVQIAEYSCFSLPMSDAIKPDGLLRLQVATCFDADYDQLWEDAKKNLNIDCAVVRSAAWMQWKYGKYCVVEARSRTDNTLIGYAAVHKTSGLLADFLAASPDVATQLLQQLPAFLQTNIASISFSAIKGMLTPAMSRFVNNMGQPDSFIFAFGCFSISDAVSFDSIHPASWYAMPND